MSLHDNLLLARWAHWRFGADSFDELINDLRSAQEGPRGDGHSYFYPRLEGRAGLRVDRSALAGYDRRVMAYEDRLRRARGDFRLKYFQWLSLVFIELYLDELTQAPGGLLAGLNGFIQERRGRGGVPADFPNFQADDLRRLAFFLATGSGKTLLMHIHVWQVKHYLEQGRHPEGLVRPLSGRRGFDHVLLVTPGEGLSNQHLHEFEASGIKAVHVAEALRNPTRYGGYVKVVEISKLAETVSGDGVSIELASLLSTNLVLVDEGHKGTGSEAQAWKSRQKALSADGFLLEYSATFAQAIGAANRRAKEALKAEYGKAILFDYSYRYFYNDGFGKDFRVLNLSGGVAQDAHAMLLGGLLLFYSQWRAHRANSEASGTYHLAQPLWVFIGASVNAVFKRDRQSQSDVATVVAFLRRFLTDQDWARRTIVEVQAGRLRLFQDSEGHPVEGLFEMLREETAAALHADIARNLFGGLGDLEVWVLKQAEGELGLRVSAPDGGTRPYFALINIGDVSEFKKHLDETLGLKTQDDQFAGSLFARIDEQDSAVKMLIGAKRFIEGWSSWRVATMGLLNMGRGEGSQVIQLFGRGVRLKGRDFGLKRSDQDYDAKPWLKLLETLHIFGWNADYLHAFQTMLEAEGFCRDVTVPVRLRDPLPDKLYVPRMREGQDLQAETWVLAGEPSIQVLLDQRPKVTYAGTLSGADGARLEIREGEGGSTRVSLAAASPWRGLLDESRLYVAMLEHKRTRRYGNLYVRPVAVREVLEHCEILYSSEADIGRHRLQQDAEAAIKTYADRLYAFKERQAESRELVPVALNANDKPGADLLLGSYTVRATDAAKVATIESLLANATLWTEEVGALPRLHYDRHLYDPLLCQVEGVGISPAPLNPGEASVVRDLREFWRDHHDMAPYNDLELYLLRNLPKVGVGFFVTSGCYPDFILWARNRKTSTVRVVFLEPHGMREETAGVECDLLKGMEALRSLSDARPFKDKGIELRGLVLTRTRQEDIRGAGGLSRDELADRFSLLVLKQPPSSDSPEDRNWWVPYALAH